MLAPEYTTRFKKDLKVLKKRQYGMDPLKEVVSLLWAETPLPEKNRDHALSGNWANHRESAVTVTATYKNENGGSDSGPGSPQTGDNSDLPLWAGLGALALAGLGGCGVELRRRQRRKAG